MGCQGTLAGWQESSSLTHLVPSGSVWSSYRKSCVDMVMKWLVPESSGRYVNRMTNEALHKGRSCTLVPSLGSTPGLTLVPERADGCACWTWKGVLECECSLPGAHSGFNCGWEREWRGHQGACQWNFLGPVRPWRLCCLQE